MKSLEDVDDLSIADCRTFLQPMIFFVRLMILLARNDNNQETHMIANDLGVHLMYYIKVSISMPVMVSYSLSFRR